MLEAYEDLERALEVKEDKNLREGVELIYKKMTKILEDEGVEAIETEHQKFDPYKHEALMTENNEDYENKCLDELIVDALAYIQQLEARVPRWIPVEEQPEPPEDDVYYCYGYWIGSGRKQAETAEYLCGEWKIANNFVLTHWMPLPEPPIGGNSDDFVHGNHG